jgi:hypothetical protein
MIKIDDTKTWVPLGRVVSVVTFAVGAAAWATAVYSAIETRVTQAEKEIVVQESNQRDLLKEVKIVNETLVEIRTVLKQQEKRNR